MFVAWSLMLGIGNGLIITSSASSINHVISNWNLAQGSWIQFTPARQMLNGDVVEFRLTVRGPVSNEPFSATIEVALARPDGTIAHVLPHVVGPHATTVDLTLRVERGGQYHIRIFNRTNSATRVVVNGNAFYRPHVIHQAAIIFDATAQAHFGSPSATRTQISNAFRLATAEFARFGISFATGVNQPTLYTLLDGGNCHNNVGNLNGICNTQLMLLGGCGTVIDCHMIHHRGTGRLNRVGTMANTYVVRVVGHGLCNKISNTVPHGDVGGAVNLAPGFNSIATVAPTGYPLRLIIQHELSHNIGVVNHCTTQNCVMNPAPLVSSFNNWCLVCRDQIIRHRG